MCKWCTDNQIVKCYERYTYRKELATFRDLKQRISEDYLPR